ncbi:MAG: efflux RND transporter periplasmic adaptor subunit [Rhizobiaceae bacterium]|nr:efflux RND transporter periplasmic adaptor subunit [Rhizobiaceae bacterium]
MPISTRSIFSILLIVIFSVLLAGCNGSDEQAGATKAPVIRPVKVVTVELVSSAFERTYSAVVLPSQEVDLSFRVSGRIIELPIRNGDQVKKGDVIARLDMRDFKANVTQIESQLVQAREKMDQLKSGARAEDIAAFQAVDAAAKAQVDSAIAQVARTEELFKKGIIAKAKLDQDVTSQRVAEATLEAKQQALVKGQSGARKEDLAAQQAAIDGVQSQLDSAKDNLSDATLRAPFDGIIATRKVENFSNIQAKEAVAVLQNIKVLDAIFDVPAPDVARLAKVKNFDLKIAIESIPGRSFKAKRSEFSTQADTATQTYRGRVTIEDLGDEIVLPGMTGSLTVTVVGENMTRILLPVVAIASAADGKAFVWVVDKADNKVSRRSISISEASGPNVIIVDGIKEGDVVAVAGISALQDGMVVKPVTAIGEVTR